MLSQFLRCRLPPANPLGASARPLLPPKDVTTPVSRSASPTTSSSPLALTGGGIPLPLPAMSGKLGTPSFVWVLAAFLVVIPVAKGAPKPGLAPKSWELQVEFRDPARIRVTLPGDGRPTTFWYMVYMVTNNTGREVPFYPQCDLVTDALQVIRSGDDVSPTVFDAIRERHRKQYPFLVPPLKASGKLLQGADNARSSVVIFREFDPEASEFTVYVAGLSGEVVRVPNPVFDPSQPQTEKNVAFFTLRKTLAIRYTIPGDLETRKHAAPIRAGRTWVMR